MLDGLPIKEYSPSALLALTVIMILVGLLVPRWVYKKKEKEAQDWKLAYETERASRITLETQLVELLEIGRTSKNVLVALFDASRRDKRTGGKRWDSDGEIKPQPKKRHGLLRTLSGYL